AADALVAAFNPQLATWGHSPFPVEVEQHLIRAIGERFGYEPGRLEGTFTSGGAEANHTALLTAITRAFPDVGRRGLMALRSQPVFYVSPGGHDSFHKAARMVGLGSESMREVAVDAGFRMRADDLAERIRQDRRDGLAPFLVVATAGSTAAGVVDPLDDIAAVAEEEGLWFHVDAAWGGAAVLLPELRPRLGGIGRASSITFDAHKWLSVPMGAGLYLTRVPGILERTFRVSAGYMPREGAGALDPYASSLQWSRRFIGLKLFLSLAVAGWDGYEAAVRHHVAMGDRLRDGLRAAGWTVVNDTPLPLVCFVDSGPEGRSAAFLEGVAADVVASGEAWISLVGLGEGNQALRACVTNYRTGSQDVDALLGLLERARERVAGAGAPAALSGSAPG
ncbi:MAG TPA: pyridoxal-dependent decarboxylase, partial [Thermoanaerobaculia bacterium]|nr:pyridoxal-dependent decarboxylase [Thermoanaerobaculia bacterium]